LCGVATEGKHHCLLGVRAKVLVVRPKYQRTAVRNEHGSDPGPRGARGSVSYSRNGWLDKALHSTVQIRNVDMQEPSEPDKAQYRAMTR